MMLLWFEDDFVESGTGRFANIQVFGMAQYLCYIFCVVIEFLIIILHTQLGHYDAGGGGGAASI